MNLVHKKEEKDEPSRRWESFFSQKKSGKGKLHGGENVRFLLIKLKGETSLEHAEGICWHKNSLGSF